MSPARAERSRSRLQCLHAFNENTETTTLIFSVRCLSVHLTDWKRACLPRYNYSLELDNKTREKRGTRGVRIEASAVSSGQKALREDAGIQVNEMQAGFQKQ